MNGAHSHVVNVTVGDSCALPVAAMISKTPKQIIIPLNRRFGRNLIEFGCFIFPPVLNFRLFFSHYFIENCLKKTSITSWKITQS